jgi:hypothetical protein
VHVKILKLWMINLLLSSGWHKITQRFSLYKVTVVI